MFLNRLVKWLGRPLSYKSRSIRALIARATERILRFFLYPVFLFFRNTYIGRSISFKCLPANEIVVAETPGINFLVNSSDLVIGRETFVRQKPFDSEKLIEAFSLIKQRDGFQFEEIDLLIDVGANIGTIGLTAVAKNLVKRCLAFEPEPKNYRLLEANIQINSLADRVDAHNIALSDGSALELEFELDNVNYGDHRVRVTQEVGLYKESSRRTIKVRASTLSEFQSVIEPNRSLLWMDTQGFEGYVLSGAAPLIAKQIPIVTEFWPYGLRRSNCFEQFIDALDCGVYKFLVVLDGENTAIQFHRNRILELADSIGWEGNHLDILIY